MSHWLFVLHYKLLLLKLWGKYINDMMCVSCIDCEIFGRLGWLNNVQSETNPVENIEKRVSFIYSNVVMNAKHNTLLIAVTFYDEKETHACIGKDSNPWRELVNF